MPSSLIAHWTFDGTTPLVDATGAYTGTPNNAAIVASGGKSGGYLSLDSRSKTAGGANSYLGVNVSSLGNNWTVSSWFQDLHPTGFTNDGWRTLFRGSQFHPIIVNSGGTDVGMWNGSFHGSGGSTAGYVGLPAWHQITVTPRRAAR